MRIYGDASRTRQLKITRTSWRSRSSPETDTDMVRSARLRDCSSTMLVVILLSMLSWASAEVCTDSVCTYDFTIEWGRTMTYPDPSGMDAYNVDLDGTQLKIVSNLFRPSFPLLGTVVDPDDVHTGDGFPRNVIMVNGKSPGPTIEVLEGAQVEVRVTNKMMEEVTSIHFHGMRQMGNSGMDGVPYMNQCPIMPGQTYTYSFKAEPRGAHLYHSHVGGQRVDGLHGLVIVHASYPTLTSFPLIISDWDHLDSRALWITSPFNNHKPGSGEQEDASLNAYNDLGLGDLNPVPPEDMVATKAPDENPPEDADGDFASDRGKRQAVRPSDGSATAGDRDEEPPVEEADTTTTTTRSPGVPVVGDGATTEPPRGEPEDDSDGRTVSINPYEDTYDLLYVASFVINGRARHDPNIKLPLTTYRVTQGNTYQIHIRHTGNLQGLKISIDNHPLRVVATDGCEIEPITVDYIFVTAGEGFTVEVDATQPVDKYWLRVNGGRLTGDPGVPSAVFTYLPEELDTNADPTSMPYVCDADNACTALNCMPGGYPAEYNTECIDISQLRAKNNNPQLYTPAAGEEVLEYFLNFGYVSGATMQGIKHVPPTGTPSSDTGLTYTPCEESCGQERPCSCFNVLNVPYNRTIQLVLSNYDAHEAPSIATHHSIHLHGFNFAVVAAGFPTINAETNDVLQANLDIDCVNADCMQPKWRSHPPDLILDHPVEKDTVSVSALGYVVIRFRSDNPGMWLLHCHVRGHSGDGMAIALMTSTETDTWDTSYLPQCHYDWDSIYGQGENGQDDAGDSGTEGAVVLSTGELVGIVIGTLLLGCAITLLVVIVHASVSYRKSEYDTRTYDNAACTPS